ncbi:hypothetical protein [Massilia glaciei]|uniref:Uncharacterized protein n=1 Tax=Massilia glaciei TaxID=1524097 RepID=A0A2U2HJS8_9BURK|nr:hypothetical protein [Massilia glaciei]PWF47702.1 hypothetical protein C7C56_014140 [Massilia glaciei]
MSAFDCGALAPAIVCRHGDLLLYLLPSAGLALVIRALAGSHPFFFVFTVAGTVCHELAHFWVGWLTGARPSSLSVIPRRAGQHWQLGSVTLTRVRWYNAAPAALAPFLIIALPFAVAWWRTGPGWRFELADLAIALALAPQWLSFWPSGADWRVARRSWPLLLPLAGAGWLALGGARTLFQFVKS